MGLNQALPPMLLSRSNMAGAVSVPIERSLAVCCGGVCLEYSGDCFHTDALWLRLFNAALFKIDTCVVVSVLNWCLF
jgi:hypothetical protein